jgi:coenzyme F420-reducing hydrogenase alpha subunit
MRCTADEFQQHVVEHQVPHSTALHAALDGRRYLTGPLARYSLNAEQLTGQAAACAGSAGLGIRCRNPYRSIIVRAVEVVYAVEEALRIIDRYRRPTPPSAAVSPVRSVGHGVSEAPRGLLYHRYELDSAGLVATATIVPPTSQNQAAIEYDLRRAVDANLTAADEDLTAMCERIIRNYDPCISCATHFLTLTIDRR